MTASATATDPRDHVAIAIAYARKAVSVKHESTFGKWTRLAAKRFLEDLERAKKKRCGFRFDVWHASDACKFIENLPHVEGTWDTPNIVMHPSHVFATVNIFGFRKLDGTRRFTTALYAVARKNAKSTWAAGVLLYCQLCEGEVGPKIVSAATTGTQARVIFDIAKRMVELDGDLREYYNVEPFANSIVSYSSGGTFRPINAKASTQDGLNPSAVGLDELHAHKNHDLLNVLKSAAGARKNPLFLFTTTEGYETPGPWPEQRAFAEQVLQGIIEADHYFAVIYAVDDEDADFDESKWEKANPLIHVNPLILSEIRKLATEAKQMPGALSEFRIKRLNRRSSVARGIVNLIKWKACGAAVDLEWLRPYPCWGGLDLASTTDLCAFRLVWRVAGTFYTWGRRWCPEAGIRLRTERNTVPYAAWVEAGLIEQTEGEVTDYEEIAAAIIEARDTFNLQSVAFDKWNATDLVNRLLAKNVPMEQFIQGPRSYQPAWKELERAYISGKLAHAGDPVLAWCAANLVPRYDQNMNFASDRKKSFDKIDDFVALLMPVGLSLNAPPDIDLDDVINNMVPI